MRHDVNARTHTHVRTHTRTRMSAQTHAHTPTQVFQCWRGDITSVPGGKTAFWDKDKQACTNRHRYPII